MAGQLESITDRLLDGAAALDDPLTLIEDSVFEVDPAAVDLGRQVQSKMKAICVVVSSVKDMVEQARDGMDLSL